MKPKATGEKNGGNEGQVSVDGACETRGKEPGELSDMQAEQTGDAHMDQVENAEVEMEKYFLCKMKEQKEFYHVLISK